MVRTAAEHRREEGERASPEADGERVRRVREATANPISKHTPELMDTATVETTRSCMASDKCVNRGGVTMDSSVSYGTPRPSNSSQGVTLGHQDTASETFAATRSTTERATMQQLNSMTNATHVSTEHPEDGLASPIMPVPQVAASKFSNHVETPNTTDMSVTLSVVKTTKKRAREKDKSAKVMTAPLHAAENKVSNMGSLVGLCSANESDLERRKKPRLSAKRRSARAKLTKVNGLPNAGGHVCAPLAPLGSSPLTVGRRKLAQAKGAPSVCGEVTRTSWKETRQASDVGMESGRGALQFSEASVAAVNGPTYPSS